MSARTTMTDLIARLRGYVASGTADYTVGTASYWTDTQLQDVLDRYRMDVTREVLAPREVYTDGTAEYYDYYSQYGDYETTDGGTAIFEVEDAAGSTAGALSRSPQRTPCRGGHQRT